MLTLLAAVSTLAGAATYSVVATRLNKGVPLLNHATGESVFDYNYNPAVIQTLNVRRTISSPTRLPAR